MTQETIVNKIWAMIGEYESYESALLKKEEVSEKYDLVKIRRGAKGQTKKEVFRVKVWKKTAAAEKKNKKKAKKGSK